MGEMETPPVFAVHEDLGLAKNGVTNGISNGTNGISNGTNGIGNGTNGISNGCSKNCNHDSKVHNRRLVEHSPPPPQEQGDSPHPLATMPTRSQLFMDPANICTLLGAVLSSLAMASMWNRR